MKNRKERSKESSRNLFELYVHLSNLGTGDKCHIISNKIEDGEFIAEKKFCLIQNTVFFS